jgi:hypothetical protein
MGFKNKEFKDIRLGVTINPTLAANLNNSGIKIKERVFEALPLRELPAFLPAGLCFHGMIYFNFWG